MRRKALGPEHPQVAGTLTVKANLLLATRHYEEARDLAVEAQRILALSLPPDSWQVAAAMNTQGAALTKLGDYARAERLLLEQPRGTRAGADPEPRRPGGASGWSLSTMRGASRTKHAGTGGRNEKSPAGPGFFRLEGRSLRSSCGDA